MRRLLPALLAGLLALGLALPARAAEAPAAPPAAPAKAPEQEVVFRVLDSRDRPVKGITIAIAPRAGRPADPAPVITGPEGEAHVTWLPRVTDENQGTHIKDRVLIYSTGMDYAITAPGFFPAQGKVDGRDSSLKVVTPELQSLNRAARLRRLVEVVVLKRPQDLWAGELRQADREKALKKILLALYSSLGPVAKELGARFTWPAFALESGTLSIRLLWIGAPWGGLQEAPLKERVVMSAGLPLALALGEDLPPLEGVSEVVLEFVGEVTPPGDPHALPATAFIKLIAPPEGFARLARGELSPDAFLDLYPPLFRQLPYPVERYLEDLS